MRASAALALLALLSGCRPKPAESASRGASAISRYGCGSCHAIPGITGAVGQVGPPLAGIKNRIYVAGMVENGVETMATWIRDPKSINPKTAMPNLGVTQQDAHDMAAYLLSK